MHVQRSGEMDITFDEPFERRWNVLQRWIIAAVAVFVAAAFAGLFGRGPLAYRTLSTPDGAVVVHYEHLARNSTPSTTLVDLGGAAATGGVLTLRLSAGLVDGLTMDAIVPRPVAERSVRDGLELAFAHAGPSAQIRLPYEPVKIGPVSGTLTVGSEPPVAIRTFVFP